MIEEEYEHKEVLLYNGIITVQDKVVCSVPNMSNGTLLLHNLLQNLQHLPLLLQRHWV